MKTNFICFKLSKTVIILTLIILIQIIVIGLEIKEVLETKNLEQIQGNIANVENKIENTVEMPVEPKQESNEIIEEQENKKEEKQEEYVNMPRELKGYKVIGKIEIPKINLSSYILDHTDKKTLKVSITKLYGPNINEVGNFCMAGHNYRNNKMFGGIKKLEKGDKIVLTTPNGKSITYEVYENYQTDPKDVSSLSQDTGGEREITMITCTAGAIKRVIVKAVEVYD